MKVQKLWNDIYDAWLVQMSLSVTIKLSVTLSLLIMHIWVPLPEIPTLISHSIIVIRMTQPMIHLNSSIVSFCLEKWKHLHLTASRKGNNRLYVLLVSTETEIHEMAWRLAI